MTVIDKPASAATGTPAPGSRELRELVEAIAAGARARDKGEAPAQDAIDLVRRARLGTFRLPRPDGAGATLPELFSLVIDLGEADSNIPHILRNHFNTVEKLLRSGHNPTYRNWLDYAREGRLFGIGASELGIQSIGSGDANTRLDERGDDYVLNGEKYYSTGNFYVDYILVNAKAPTGRIATALVPRDHSGVNVEDDWDGIGQRLTASGTSVFTDVPVRRDDVVFLDEEEVKLPFEATFPQLYLTSIVTGILRSIVRDATTLVQGRERNYYHAVSAQPAGDPLLQQTVGRLASIAYVAESSVLRAAEALGAALQSAIDGRPEPALFQEAALRTAKSKVVIDDLALGAANQLFEVGGASAARQSAQLDRHWRNIRTISSHNPLSYKARALGSYIVNGEPLPTGAFF